MAKRVYEDAVENEWFSPIHRGFRLMCCDCGLVHVVDYKIVDDCVHTKVKRDNRATATARRGSKYKGVKV